MHAGSSSSIQLPAEVFGIAVVSVFAVSICTAPSHMLRIIQLLI